MMEHERDSVSDSSRHGRRLRKPVQDIPPSTILFESGFATGGRDNTQKFGIKPTQSFISGIAGSIAANVGDIPRSSQISAASASKRQDRDLIMENLYVSM